MPIFPLPEPGATYQHVSLGPVLFEREIYSGAEPVILYLCIRLDTGEQVTLSEDELIDLTEFS